MVEQALLRDVLHAFEYAHHREDWVCPLVEALAGVTAQDTTALP